MIQDYPYDSAVSDASLKTFVAFLAFLGLVAVLWLFLFALYLAFLFEFWNWRIWEKSRGGYYPVILRPNESYLVSVIEIK